MGINYDDIDLDEWEAVWHERHIQNAKHWRVNLYHDMHLVTLSGKTRFLAFDWLVANNYKFKWEHWNANPYEEICFGFYSLEDKVMFALRWA